MSVSWERNIYPKYHKPIGFLFGLFLTLENSHSFVWRRSSSKFGGYMVDASIPGSKQIFRINDMHRHICLRHAYHANLLQRSDLRYVTWSCSQLIDFNPRSPREITWTCWRTVTARFMVTSDFFVHNMHIKNYKIKRLSANEETAFGRHT